MMLISWYDELLYIVVRLCWCDVEYLDYVKLLEDKPDCLMWMILMMRYVMSMTEIGISVERMLGTMMLCDVQRHLYYNLVHD